MHETTDELGALQDLLDRSYGSAGAHLRSITTPGRRMDAAETCRRLQGVCLLSLATVTADGRPLVGPVDGIFHRGRFAFGTATDAVRTGHIDRRPDVSATHLLGEEWAVTVHGRAVPADIADPAPGGLREALLEVYTPRYGPQWSQFLDSGNRYWWIEPRVMFTFRFTPEG
jgi:hypothetical protein